jgi:hypothetical protein
LYGEHPSIINESNASVYNVSGFSDYVFRAESNGSLGFNVSDPRIAGFNGSTLKINNSLGFYHTKNGTLINYSKGSAFQSCSGYSNGTTVCFGTLPVVCYLGSSGETACQTEYGACYGGGYASSNSSMQSGLLFSYNYTCNTSYSPPKSVTLDLNTHPGITLGIILKWELLTYGKRNTSKIGLSISSAAPEGTYLASFDPSSCGTYDYSLITIGNAPYNGTIRVPPEPLLRA